MSGKEKFHDVDPSRSIGTTEKNLTLVTEATKSKTRVLNLCVDRYFFLRSKDALPVLDVTKELVISTDYEDFTEELLSPIFEYSAMCKAMRKLEFLICWMPFHINKEVVSPVGEEGIKISWYSGTVHSTWYHYNVSSGKWEDENGTAVTEAEYKIQKRGFDERRKGPFGPQRYRNLEFIQKNH